MQRFEFKPYNWDSIQTFNGSLMETRIMYYINTGLRNENILEYLQKPFGSYLHGFLLAIGSYKRLWIGDLDGIIAPMDVQPEGWTYPNGESLEPSWFWQWHPSEISHSKLLQDSKKTNIFDFTENIDKGRFKSLVPMKFHEKYGEIQTIGAFPVMRLPAIMKDCTWTIEVDQ